MPGVTTAVTAVSAGKVVAVACFTSLEKVTAVVLNRSRQMG